MKCTYILKNWNDNQGLKPLCDGVTWYGDGFVNGKKTRKELTAGNLCREVLEDIFALLPLQVGPASAEDRTTSGRECG